MMKENRVSNSTEIVDQLESEVDELTQQLKVCLDQSPHGSGSGSSSREVRAESRYPVTCPLIVIPVCPDGRPDQEQRVEGVVRDVSIRGIGALLSSKSDCGLSDCLLIGLDKGNGEYAYAGVKLKHTDRLGKDDFLLGAEFGGKIQEILQAGEIMPVFRPDRMEFGFEYDSALLDSLKNLGSLREVVIDQIQVCPECHGLPTFRQACRKCGLTRIKTDRLIHHFACAHVGLVADFETAEGLACPKCRTRNPVAGADFEYLTGQFHCQDCHATDTELGQFGHCLRCGFRFPGHQSAIQDVKGFHANRLDSLDLLAAR